MHSKILLEHFHHLDHAGSLPFEPDLRTAEVGHEQQGDLIVLQISVKDDIIQHAHFQCYGGVVTLASCEFLCRWLEGKTTETARGFNTDFLLTSLELSSLHVHVADRLQHLLSTVLRRVG